MRKLAAALFWAASASAQVQLTHLEDRVTVTIDGQLFGSLYFGKKANKPFFHPLTTSSGVKVTRSFPLEKADGEPTDHPHQKGLWVGTERLSGMDFWENDSSYHRPRMGKIVFKDVTRQSSGAGLGVLRFRADWIGPEGQTAIAEDRTMTFYAGIGDARIVDVDLTLTAIHAVTFEDHQDALIGIRLSPAFDERNGGMPVNAEGLRGETEVRGKASRFVDWRTRIDGADVGVAILDHPENLNAPARWHMRGFGFFTANPFGRKVFDDKAESARKSLKASDSIHLRYRVIVHTGDFDVAASWREFAATRAAAVAEVR